MPTLLAQVRFDTGVEDAWRSVATFVPKLIGFLAVVLLGYVVARALAAAVDAVLERVGFDRAVERGGVGRALAPTRYDASDLVSKLVFYALLLFVLQLAFGIFGPNPVSDLLGGAIAYLPKVFAAGVILVVAAALAAVVRELVRGSLAGSSSGATLASVAGAVVLGVGAFAALSQLRVAPAIVHGLFYWVLAVTGGVAVVAAGGAGIGPLRSRWERALLRVENEVPRMRFQAREAARSGAEAARPQAVVGSRSLSAAGAGVVRAPARPTTPAWVWGGLGALLGLLGLAYLVVQAVRDGGPAVTSATATTAPAPATTAPATTAPAPATTAAPAPTTAPAPAAPSLPPSLEIDGREVLPELSDATLAQNAGRRVAGRRLRVESVVSDEGFWVGENAQQRVFCLLPTSGESPFQAVAGQRIVFAGPIRPLAQNLGVLAGVGAEEGSQQLASQQHYVEVESVRAA